MMNEISEKERALAKDISLRGAFSDFVGPLFRLPDLPDENVWRYFFRPEQKHMNAAGSVHGGMLMSFVDVAMGQTARSCSDAARCSTVSLTCDFVGPGRLGDVIDAQITPVRKTRNFVFMHGLVTSGGRTLVSAQGMWKIYP